MLYFIQTTRFIPIDFKKYGFKIIDGNKLILESDNSIWEAIELYDLGWGKEKGYYRTPMPDKNELYKMAFPVSVKNDFESRFNYWGSITVLLDKYCDFLLERMSEEFKINRKFLDKHKETLLYIDSELNISDALLNRLSDKKLIQNIKKWKKIKEYFSF